jgi:hypothetical protein
MKIAPFCSVDLDWVSRDVRDLVLNENLQNAQPLRSQEHRAMP